MGLNLGKLGKKITDILGVAGDAIIPGDQSSWHQGTPTLQQQVSPAVNQVGRAISRGPVGLIGLGAQKAAGLDKQLIGGFVSHLPGQVKPAANFVNNNIISPQLTAFERQGAVQSGNGVYAPGIKGVGQAITDLANIGSFLPIGAAAKGATLGSRVIRGAVTAAPVGGIASIGNSLEHGDNLATGATNALLSAGATASLGAAAPIVGAGARAGGRAISRAIGNLKEARPTVKLPAPEPVAAPQPIAAPKTAAAPPTDVPLNVTNKGTLKGDFNAAFTDKEAPIINYLKNVEKQTGQTGLVDQFYYDTGLQRRSNAIANAKIQASPEIKSAFGGLKGGAKNEFDAYVAARNELSNAQRGLPTSKPVSELQATVDNLAPAHAQRFDALRNFYRDQATALHDAGIIDSKTLQDFNQSPDYTRIQRVMDDVAPRPGASGGNSMSLGQSLTRLSRKGSSRDIQPADMTAFDYAQGVQKEIQRNQAASNLIDVLKSQGHAKQLTAQEAVNKNYLKRMVNGKAEIYQVPKDIKEIADNVTPFQLGALGRIISAPQRLLRAGATGLSAPFTAANYVKDQASSAVFSKNVVATHAPANIASGIYQAAKDFGVGVDDPLWQKFTQHLGDTTQYDFIRNAKNAKLLSRELRLGQKGRIANSTIHPIRTLEDLNQITEKATRFQNFKGIYQKAIKDGLSETEATKQATLAAWQNSVDFSRMGNVTQALNLLIPYFNAGVQGTRLLGRSFAQRPLATSAKTVGLIGMPLMGITLWNMSDPERKAIYNNISDYEKEHNMVFVLPGAHQLEDGSYEGVFKIPLQQGLSNLVQPIRLGVESYANQAPADVAKMATQFLGAVSGPINTDSPGAAIGGLIPQVAKPLVQQAANTDFFSGKPIVQDYINKATDANGNPIAENKKAYPYTSGSSRMIGDALNVSPIRVDKFIKDTSGKVGQYTQNAVDSALAAAGVIPKEQIGGVSVPSDFVRRFARASGKENFNKSEGAKYYDNLKQVTSGLNTNEQSAFNSLHPNKKNFLGDTIMEADSTYNPAARLDIYNRYPKVFEADKALDQKNRDAGKPGNPLFDLASAQVKKVLEKDNLPPGAKDPELSNLYNQPWYQDYQTKKSAYFTAVKDNQAKELADAKASGDTKKADAIQQSIDKFNNQSNPYPTTDPKLQQTMDYYSSLPKGTGARKNWINTHQAEWQAMQNQFAAIDNWQNAQRGKRGLAATEGDAGKANGFNTSTTKSYGGGGGTKTAGSPYKYSVSLNAGGAIRKAKVSVKSPGSKKVASRGSAKPKVSIKKSLV